MEHLYEIQGLTIEQDTRLSKYTTFQLGGPAAGVVSCQDPQDLRDALLRLRLKNIPYLVIGEGANILASDYGSSAVIVRYVTEKPQISVSERTVTVSGHTRLDDLAVFAAQNGFVGLEFASGIPGTVAGAIVGNAGAFGKQIAETLKTVTLLAEDLTPITMDAASLQFAYRDSLLKRTRDIILSAQFLLGKGDPAHLLSERERMRSERKEKHPDYKVWPCAGSFFKNVSPDGPSGPRTAAGWYLDQAGAKQMSVGGAAVFEKHANIIIKKAHYCRAQDVYELSKRMAQAVEKKFGIRLEREVRLLGRFEDNDVISQQGFW